MSEAVLNQIKAIGLMPVIASVRVEDSENLAGALVRGGIPAAEVTFRMERAEEVIVAMRRAYPDMVIGAGTVTSVELVDKAAAAGAKFIVSPGLNPKVVEHCHKCGLEVIPGVVTPSEIEQAMELGLHTLNFFPAEQNGGLAAIKAICGPYKGVEFMPTGGISLKNLAEYLSYDRITACGGTYMLGNYAQTGEWDKIMELCRTSVQTMLGLQIAHAGIPSTDEMQAHEAADAAAQLLGLNIGKEGSSSVFVDQCLEILKAPGNRTLGHVAFQCNNITRAVSYYKAMGAQFDEASAKYDTKGNLIAIYFKQKINGFAFHLVRA